MIVFILEDNSERCAEMLAVLAKHSFQLSGKICKSAREAIDHLASNINEIDLICLDHDLESSPDNPEPGDGRDVVQWLVSQPIRKPVLIHTSNGMFGREMEQVLCESGWQCERLVPYDGHDWIAKSWPAWLGRMSQGS